MEEFDSIITIYQAEELHVNSLTVEVVRRDSFRPPFLDNIDVTLRFGLSLLRGSSG